MQRGATNSEFQPHDNETLSAELKEQRLWVLYGESVNSKAWLGVRIELICVIDSLIDYALCVKSSNVFSIISLKMVQEQEKRGLRDSQDRWCSPSAPSSTHPTSRMKEATSWYSGSATVEVEFNAFLSMCMKAGKHFTGFELISRLSWL